MISVDLYQIWNFTVNEAVQLVPALMDGLKASVSLLIFEPFQIEEGESCSGIKCWDSIAG